MKKRKTNGLNHFLAEKIGGLRLIQAFRLLGFLFILNACNFQIPATGTGTLMISADEGSAPVAVNQNFLSAMAETGSAGTSGGVNLSFLFYNEPENAELTNIDSLNSVAGDFLYLKIFFASVSDIGVGTARIDNENGSQNEEYVIALSITTDESLATASGTFEGIAREGEIQIDDISVDSEGKVLYAEGWYQAIFGSGNSWLEGNFTVTSE